MWTKSVFLFPIFISFYLFPFNFIDADESNANLHKNIKNWILVADCFLSPPKFSFDFQMFGFKN